MNPPTCSIYPPELGPSHWERRKNALPERHEVGDLLRALQKKHEAIDWRLFDASWADAADSSVRLRKEFERRERLYRGAVLALGREAGLLKAAARTLEKGAARPTQEAARAIAAACERYARAIEAGLVELDAQHERARVPLERRERDLERQASAAGADGPEDDEATEPLDILLSPQRLLQQLKLCRRDPERRVNFAYIDGRGGDEPAVLVLHPRIPARRLFARLQAETGRKVGTHGTSWLEETRLMLQPHKPVSGMARKVRAPVRAAGFRITRAVLCQPDGSVIEQDVEVDADMAGDMPAGADVDIDIDIDVEGRVDATPGADDAAGAEDRTAAAAAADDPAEAAALAAQWQVAAARIGPRVAAALASGPDDGDRIGALWAFARDKAAAGRHASALAALKTLVPWLQPASEPDAGALLLADLKTRFQALREAFAVLPEHAAEGTALLRTLPAQVQAGDLDAARQAMARLDALIAEAAGREALRQRVQSRLMGLTLRYRQLAMAPAAAGIAPLRQQYETASERVSGLAGARDFAAAEPLLDDLERLLAVLETRLAEPPADADERQATAQPQAIGPQPPDASSRSRADPRARGADAATREARRRQAAARDQWTAQLGAARGRIEAVEGGASGEPEPDLLRARCLQAIAQARARADAGDHVAACARLAAGLVLADEFLAHRARLDDQRLRRLRDLRGAGAATLPFFTPRLLDQRQAADQVQQAMDADPDLAGSAGLNELVQASRRADRIFQFAVADPASSAALGATASIQGLMPMFDAYMAKNRFNSRRQTRRDKYEQAMLLLQHHRQQLAYLDSLAPTLARLETFDVAALARTPDEATRAIGWLDALLLSQVHPAIKTRARGVRHSLVITLMATATTRQELRRAAEIGGPAVLASFDRQEALGPLADTVRHGQARARHATTRIHNVANAENVEQSRLLSTRLVADDGSFELAALYRFDTLDLAGDTPSSRQMARALNLLRASPEALVRLESIQAPAPRSNAARLVRTTLGLAPNTPVTDAHARRAALASLLCELRQDQVGSCFATQEVIRMHDTDPAVYLGDVTQMLNEGRITRRLPSGKQVAANTQVAMPVTTTDTYVMRLSRGPASQLVGSTRTERLATPAALHEAPGFQAAMAAIGIAPEHAAVAMDRALADMQATSAFRRHQNQRAVDLAVAHIADPAMRARVQIAVRALADQRPHRVRRALTAAMLNVDPTLATPLAVPAAERAEAERAFQEVLDAPEFGVEPALVIEALARVKLGLTEADVKHAEDCENLRREIATHPDMIAGTKLERPRDGALLDQCDRLEAMDLTRHRMMIHWEPVRREAIARFQAEDQCPLLRACEYTLTSLLEHGRMEVGPMEELQHEESKLVEAELKRLAQRIAQEPRFARTHVDAAHAAHIAKRLMGSYHRLFAEGTSTGYDASVSTGTLADGSSRLGAWCLYDIQGIKDPDRWIKIQSAEEYGRLVKGIMMLAWKVTFEDDPDPVVTELGRALAEALCVRLSSEDFTRQLSRASVNLARNTLATPWLVVPSGRYVGSAIEVLDGRRPTLVTLPRATDAREMVGRIGGYLKTLWNDPATGVRDDAEQHGEAATVTVSNRNVHVFSLVPGDADLRRMLSDPRDFDVVLDERIAKDRRRWRKASSRTRLHSVDDVNEQLYLLMGTIATPALGQQVWAAIERRPTMQAFYEEMRRVYRVHGHPDASIDDTLGEHAIEFLVPPIPAADLERKLRQVATALEVPAARIDAVVGTAHRALLALDPVRATVVDIRDELELAMRAEGLDTRSVVQQRIAPVLRESTGLIFADSNWGDAEHRVKFALIVNPVTGEPGAWSMNEDGSAPQHLDRNAYIRNEWIVAT